MIIMTPDVITIPAFDAFAQNGYLMDMDSLFSDPSYSYLPDLKSHLVTKKASTVVDWPDLDKETMGKVKKKIDTGWDIHLKEDE